MSLQEENAGNPDSGLPIDCWLKGHPLFGCPLPLCAGHKQQREPMGVANANVPPLEANYEGQEGSAL